MKIRQLKIAIPGMVIIAALAVFLTADRPETGAELSRISNRSGAPRADTEFLNLQKAAEYYKLQIRKNPHANNQYVELAQLYLQQARITGRHHAYIGMAREMLDEVLRRDADHFEALLTRTSILLTQHQFAEALNLAEEATRLKPNVATAWGLLSDARKELGDYTGAVQACDKMLSIRPDLRSYSRAAHLREIHGDLDGARTAMELAANAGVMGLESHAWTLYQLGNLYLLEGQLDSAEVVFAGILQTRPNYAHALAGLAHIDFLTGEYDRAIQKLLQAYALAPEHAFMERLVKIYRAVGREETASVLQASVVEAFKDHERQGWNVNLEKAAFSAEHGVRLQEALDRIEEEYRVRPENIEVLETYAWLLFKTERLHRAAELMKRALRFNTRNPRLYYRAGTIEYEIGDYKQANIYFKTALAINPNFRADERGVMENVRHLATGSKFSTAAYPGTDSSE